MSMENKSGVEGQSRKKNEARLGLSSGQVLLILRHNAQQGQGALDGDDVDDNRSKSLKPALH